MIVWAKPMIAQTIHFRPAERAVMVNRWRLELQRGRNPEQPRLKNGCRRLERAPEILILGQHHAGVEGVEHVEARIDVDALHMKASLQAEESEVKNRKYSKVNLGILPAELLRRLAFSLRGGGLRRFGRLLRVENYHPA